MNTKFIGVKHFRQNMAKIAGEARKKGERIIILRKNRPLFELRPISNEDALVEILKRDIDEARADKKAGRVKSAAEVAEMFGL